MPQGRLHYVGGVGSGFSEKELGALREKLDALAADKPANGDHRRRSARCQHRLGQARACRGGAVRGLVGLRPHPPRASILGLREDKAPREVVRDIPDPDEPRKPMQPRNRARIAEPGASARRNSPSPRCAAGARAQARRPPTAASSSRRSRSARASEVGGIEITHPERALWPGITKRDLAEYWQAIADWALPGLAHRPLAILRCPEGIEGEHFFQKRGHNLLPEEVREGTADGSPYLAIDGLDGLIALAQMSAIELHPWGAAEADALHPDWIVFDLDPGEGVPFPEVVRAALDLRKRLEALGLAPFPAHHRRQGPASRHPARAARRLGRDPRLLPRLRRAR